MVSEFLQPTFSHIVLNSKIQQQTEATAYKLIRPKGGDCLIKQVKKTQSIRMPKNSAAYMSVLYSVMNTYFVDAEWVPIVQFLNNTDAAITLPATLKSQFVVEQNVRHVELQELIDGLCIRSGGMPFKTFCVQETSSPETKKFKTNVKPNNYVVIYQKRWRFKHKLWFITSSELNGEEKIVGRRPNNVSILTGNEGPDYPIIERSITSYVDSCEYTVVDINNSAFIEAAREVDITPVEGDVSKGMMRKHITNIPSHHQEVIVQLLI